MPYPNEHAARLIQPGRFEEKSFRRKNISSGINIIIGKLKGQSKTTTQAYRFSASKFTASEARKWLKDHNIKYISFEAATGEKKTQAFISLQGMMLQAFSESDILEIIPNDVLAKIKEKDPHPYFQAFSIAHEGISMPKVLGDTETKPISWSRKAIQSIKGIITKGIKFFLGHNNDNSTNDREALGEIVADIQREIDNKLHHIVIGYFSDRERVKEYDICSQEADWNLLESASNYIADKIEKLTGIALGNSNFEKPAFSGAKRLAIVQAFEDTNIVMDNDYQNNAVDNSKNKGDQMDLTTINFQELLGELKRRALKPSQVFDFEEIKNDKEFNKIINDNENKLKELEVKVETLENEKKNLDSQVMKSTAQTRLDALMGKLENPLTESQKKFIKYNFDKKFKDDKLEDLTDEGLKIFVNNKLDDFKAAIDSGLLDNKDDNIHNSTINTNTNIDPEDYTKAANNPFLTEDYNIT